MEVVVDKKKCVACGFCVASAPKFFKFDKDGKATFIGKIQSEEDKKLIKEIANGCPQNAIIIK